MKKYLFFLVALAALVSCGSNSFDEESTTEQSISFSKSSPEIILKLQTFNDSLLQSNNSKSINNLQTRGGKRWWVTSSADILAAINAYKGCIGIAAFITAATGGTATFATGVCVLGATAFLAGGASYAAYKNHKEGCTYGVTTEEYLSKLKNNKNYLEKYESFILNCNSLEQAEDDSLSVLDRNICAQVGKLHNDILTCLVDSVVFPSTRSSIIEENPEVPLDDKAVVNYDSPYFIDVYSEDDIVSLTNELTSDMSIYYESDDYDKTIESFKSKNSVTENVGDILSLFFSALYNSVNEKTTLIMVINKYEQTVNDSSELSTDEKNVLLVGFETARYSCSYWYDKDL